MLSFGKDGDIVKTVVGDGVKGVCQLLEARIVLQKAEIELACQRAVFVVDDI